ncbi:hypothetical protein HDU93_001531 [Gonapodya sp. JEL0774]|nr:hypothetical protein HDU93_001531 [Gonapodya sp. JEL0774]
MDETLDLDLIRQEAMRSSPDVLRYIDYVIDMMLKLCAPFRDPAIRELKGLLKSDPVGAIEGILKMSDDMKLDLANYRLSEIRPHLAKSAVLYERSKFADALSRGDVSLDRTREWLGNAVQSLRSVAASRNPEGIETMPHTAIRFEDVFVEGLLSLIFSQNAVDRTTVPETMLLDVERLFGFQNDAQLVAVIASLIMLSKNIVPELRTEEKGVKMLTDTLTVLLDATAEGVTTEHLSLQLISSMNKFLESKHKVLLSEQEKLVKQMVEKTLSYRDAVFSLISRRVQDKVRQQLQSGMFPKQTLASSGLDCVAELLEKFSRKTFFLARHNKEVFSPYYDDIIRELLA